MCRFINHKKEHIVSGCHNGLSSNSLQWRYFFLVLLFVNSFVTWYSAQADESYINKHLENAQSQDMRIEDVKTGRLLMKTDTQAVYHQALMLNSEVYFSVNGMVANTHLKQSFTNTSSDWVEGVYAFPLPETASVHRMTIKIGERVIKGKVLEKQTAKYVYQSAKLAGKKAGLVEQYRPNLFTTQIANIAPYETIEVQIEYIQDVSYENGVFGLRFPMTITPRYTPAAEPSSHE